MADDPEVYELDVVLSDYGRVVYTKRGDMETVHTLPYDEWLGMGRPGMVTVEQRMLFGKPHTKIKEWRPADG